MLKVGITGGIGSGKSYICHIFNQLGVEVYSADEQAKSLMNTNIELMEGIRYLIGSEAYINGELNRKLVAQKIFTNKELLNELNSLVHPAVAKDFTEWCQKRSASIYILHEAAILFESGFYKLLDKNIVVTAPEEIRIDRVKKRDATTVESVQERMKNQWPTEKTVPLADFVIENDNKKLILPQILKIDQILKEEWQNMVNG